jgi:hypothetical protein
MMTLCKFALHLDHVGEVVPSVSPPLPAPSDADDDAPPGDDHHLHDHYSLTGELWTMEVEYFYDLSALLQHYYRFVVVHSFCVM